ncbi:GGDEF domain-containing protein [Kineococcus sp. SYSU DK002]|uniref:GGDEF domain-containing protein n=1 Tax=Kineococcus sp. SYSU DK002 TaxID=3383123 RepID=UPI003D7CC6A5
MQDADYRRLVEDSPLATVLVERATGDGAPGWRATWLNRAAADLFAVPTAPRPVAGLVHPDDLPDVLAALDRGAGGDRTAHEWRFLSGDGGVVTVEVLIGPAGRGADALTLSCWDVTQHVERARDLTHRATHDRLTGLPNRGLLEDRWELARSRARRSGDAPLVAFCDVDDLKQLNDEHGHLVGDRALVRIAERLAGVSRAGDTVARFGGDEFIVLVDTSAEVDPRALEQRLREAVSGVLVDLPDGSRVSVRCSVGLVADDLSESTAEVLARADRHMYEDKRRHRS